MFFTLMVYASRCQRNWGHFSCFAKIFPEMAFFENTQFLSISLILSIKVEVIEIGYNSGDFGFFSNFSHNTSYYAIEIHRNWVCSVPSFYEFQQNIPNF